MTCAAIGAIYYGWAALSDQERNDILDKISVGMQIGIEFIRSIINFVTAKTKEVLSSRQLAEIKEFIRGAAATFGMKLGDVTRAVADRVADTALAVKDVAGTLVKNASYGVVYSTTVAADTASAAAETATRGAKRASRAISETATTVAEKTAGGALRASKVATDAAVRAKESVVNALAVNGNRHLKLKDAAEDSAELEDGINTAGKQ
jgi:hypothetical protein